MKRIKIPLIRKQKTVDKAVIFIPEQSHPRTHTLAQTQFLPTFFLNTQSSNSQRLYPDKFRKNWYKKNRISSTREEKIMDKTTIFTPKQTQTHTYLHKRNFYPLPLNPTKFKLTVLILR